MRELRMEQRTELLSQTLWTDGTHTSHIGVFAVSVPPEEM